MEDHFLENLPAAQVMRPEKSAPVVRYLNGRAWRAPQGFAPAEVRVLCGHYFGRSTGDLLVPHNALEAILIRDPLGLYLSWYNYRMTRHQRWGRRIPKFEDWYRSQGRNPVARHLLTRHLGWSELKFTLVPATEIIAEARRALDSFWFVGEYRHVDALLAAAGEKFGVPSRAPQRNITQYKFLPGEKVSHTVVDQVRRENAIDQYLFDRYKNRRFDQGSALDLTAPRPGRLVGDEIRRLAAWTSIKMKRAR